MMTSIDLLRDRLTDRLAERPADAAAQADWAASLIEAACAPLEEAQARAERAERENARLLALLEGQSQDSQTDAGRRTLDALMEFIPEGVVVLSAHDLRVLYASRHAARMYGKTRAEIEGRLASELVEDWEIYHSDGQLALFDLDYPPVRAARDGEIVIDKELTVTRGGETVMLLYNSGPIRDAEGRTFASVSTVRDITERKREERHQRFISELGRALVALRSPEEVLEGVSYRLGRYLGVDRCFIGEALGESDVHHVRCDYHPGLPSVAKDMPLNVFPERVIERMARGKPVVISEMSADPLAAGPKGNVFLSAGIRAMLSVPWFNQEGRWVGSLNACCGEPRAWRADEVQLMQSIGDLTRLALENAHLLQDLQNFRSRFELALCGSSITVFTVDRDLRITWMFNARNRRDEDLLGKLPDALFEQVPVEPLLDLMREVLASGVSLRREVLLPFSNRVTSYDATVEPLRDGDQLIYGLTVALMETTQLRHMKAESLRQLAQIEMQRSLISERERERTRIARDLHDGPLQDLIATNFNLVEAMDINDKEPRLAKMRLIQDMLRQQINELRRFCNELRPPVLAPFGLEKTIRSHVESLGELYPWLKIRLRLQRDGQRLPEEVRMTLYRIYQELITNVIRHSRASEAVVRLRLEEQQVILEVEDNGVGFPTPGQWVDLAREGHLGLVGVRERVEMTRGEVEVDTQPGTGTRVRVRMPLA